MTNAPVRTPPRPFFTWKIGMLMALLALILIGAGWLVFSLTRTEFPLKEIPTPASEGFRDGPRAVCLKAPSTDVARYPRFTSSAPLFGRIDLDSNASGGRGLVAYHFALDESKGTGAGYDTLYFDANSNLDLTDDKLLTGQPGAPELTTPFENVAIPWNFGPGMPSRTVEFIPGLRSDTSRDTTWFILAYASARRGRIRIGRRAYDVTLTCQGSINGRYDNPDMKSMLYAVRPGRVCFFKHHRLFNIHAPENEVFPLIQMPHVGGKWYRFSTTPLGDVLSVKPYNGDTGVLRMGSLDRPGSLSAMGYILNRETFIRLEEKDDCGYASWVDRCDIPVGDYDVGYLIVKAGSLQVGLRHNTASDGIPNDRDNHPPRYFIEIRKDKPFNFELPKALSVLFASPAKNQRFKPGDTIEVRSALLDPVRDIRVTRIGESLVPRITITDSSANVVSETTPIDDLISYGFSWKIPTTFQPKGREEKLTITVTYDTFDLFGIIRGSCEIIIEK